MTRLQRALYNIRFAVQIADYWMIDKEVNHELVNIACDQINAFTPLADEWDWIQEHAEYMLDSTKVTRANWAAYSPAQQYIWSLGWNWNFTGGSQCN